MPRRDEDREKVKLKFSRSMPREQAAAYFSSIIAGVKSGAIQLMQGDGNVVFTPAADLDVEVKAVRKEDKERIYFEISWPVPPASDLDIRSR